MKSILFAILAIGFQIPSWASSGVAPFWIYQTEDGTFLARMSDKAEEDDYNGVTQGAVKSKLFIYKMTNGTIPAKPTLITTVVCESFRNEQASIKCPSATGPFSGTVFKSSSNYIFESVSKGRLRPKLVQGSTDQVQKNRAMLLIGAYVKSKDYKGSFGISGFGILNCVEGCKSAGTPNLLVEVALMGD